MVCLILSQYHNLIHLTQELLQNLYLKLHKKKKMLCIPSLIIKSFFFNAIILDQRLKYNVYFINLLPIYWTKIYEGKLKNS